MNRIRYSMWIAAIFFALILSAMNVAPALADESAPPEPAPTEEAVDETESTTPEEEAVTPPADEETDSAVETESTSVAEVVEALPEDTTLVVVDENGEALPLASEEAAEAIELADPQWCPAGVTPGGAGCSPVFSSFNDVASTPAVDTLIEWLIANPQSKAGVIWIEKTYTGTGALEGAAVILDGSLYGTTANFALTINGGWNGGTLNTMDVNDPSEFNVPFRIINWVGAVTINNIVVNGASGVSVSALEVFTSGNITLNNVDAVNNTTQYGGAYLDNDSGTGNVAVNNSTFNNNTGVNGTGLEIRSNGTVTLNNVTANGNTEYGAYILNNTAATPKAVTVKGTNHFNYNGLDGLSVNTKGVITVSNVFAMGNVDGFGAYLDNCNYNNVTGFCGYSVANGVTIKGTNNFSNNGWDGLRVWSGGVISVSNITANGNGASIGRPMGSAAPNNFDAGGKGAFLHNWGSTTPKNIVVSGTNVFNSNMSAGLLALGWGSVTVNNITANNNGCDLVYEINDYYCAGAYLEGQMGVTQTGYGRFENNSEIGLRVSAVNKGAVTLNNLFADYNGETGVRIFTSSASPINVTINGINTFTNNGDEGLFIVANGVIKLSNLTANYNGLEGAYIDNTPATTSPKPVTLLGVNNFIGNDNGLVIYTDGIVALNNITASFNTFDGAYIDNSSALSALGVTIKGTSVFNGNSGGEGLEIYSNGAVILANISADFNSNGAYIYNEYDPSKPSNVTISGFNRFEANTYTGLSITSYGAVILSNLTANYNGSGISYYGVYVDNNNGTLARPVTLTGTNTMNGNNGGGLLVESLGAITLNNLTANYNFNGVGAFLDNNDVATISQPVTIKGYGVFNENSDIGLLVYTNGNVVFANITANNNNNGGAYIQAINNVTATTFANVTLTGVNTFNENNNLHGIYVATDGAITISNITANENSTYGAYLDNITNANSGPTGIKAVTLNGVNMFNNNIGDGLSIDASGNVTLTRVTANYNNDLSLGAPQSSGVYVNSSAGNIVFTCGSLNYNEGGGYSLTVAGVGKTITLKGVYAFGNGAPNTTSGTTTITRACPLP